MLLYDPMYSRILRVVDFIIKIHISFFFTLIQYSITPNTAFEAETTKRDITNIGKSIDDFAPQIQEVFFFILYNYLVFKWVFIFDICFTL